MKRYKVIVAEVLIGDYMRHEGDVVELTDVIAEPLLGENLIAPAAPFADEEAEKDSASAKPAAEPTGSSLNLADPTAPGQSTTPAVNAAPDNSTVGAQISASPSAPTISPSLEPTPSKAKEDEVDGPTV